MAKDCPTITKKMRSGFIQIPLLIAIIAAVVVSSVGVGVFIYQQQKSTSLTADVSQVVSETQEIIVPVDTEDGTESEAIDEEVVREEQELQEVKFAAEIEKVRQEVEKAKAEAEKAKAEAEKAIAEAEKFKIETEQQTQQEKPVQPLSNATSTEPSGPKIVSVSPNQIFTNLISNIVIAGENFSQSAEVIIGGIIFGTGDFASDTGITIQIKPGVLGPTIYDIQVRNIDGKAATLKDALTVVNPPSPTTQEQGSRTTTTQEIASQVSPAIVQIFNSVRQGAGSGMILDSAGYILTNEHVIRGDSSVDVSYDGQIFYNTPVIGWDAVKDLAVVKLAGSNFPSVNLGNSNNIALGQDVVALGYPLSNFPSSITALEGIISNTSVIDNIGVTYIQTSANVQHGSSGGPLLDVNTNVVGVTSWCPDIDITSGLCPAGYALAIKINEVKSILIELKAGKKVSRPESTPPPPAPPPPAPAPPPPEPTTPGTLTVSLDSSQPDASLVAGSTTVTLAVFRLAADDKENLDLDSIQLNVLNGDRVSTYFFYHGSTLLGSRPSGTTPSIEFADGTVTIPGNDKVLITVKGEIKGVTTPEQNNTQIQVSIANAGDIDTTGLSSGSAIDSTETNLDANIHTVFESYPTFSVNSGSPSGDLIPSVSGLLAIFDVTAHSNGDITFENADGNSLTVNVSQSVADDDGDTETWVLKDSSGNTLDTATADISTTSSITFDFSDKSLAVPSSQTKSLYVYSDTTELEDNGDVVQLWLDDNATTNIAWGIDTVGSYNHADVIFLGDIFAGSKVNPS